MCVDNQIWKAYAKNTIGKKDLKYIQNHVSTCEICADIKDGIDAMPKPQKLPKRIKKINLAVDQYIIKKNKTKYMIWFGGAAAAAAICVCVGLVWFLFGLKKENIALKTDEKESVFTQTDSLIMPPAVSETPEKLALNKESDSKPIVKSKPKRLSENKITESEMVIAMNAAEQSAIQDEVSNDTKGKAVETESQSENIVSKDSDVARSNLATPALANSEAVQVSKSKKSIASAIQTTLYSQAQQTFINSKFDSCLFYINKIDSQSINYQDALFLKAQVFLKKNDSASAKIILNDLLKMKAANSKQAEELLQSIK
jgi:hypothetical protein